VWRKTIVSQKLKFKAREASVEVVLIIVKRKNVCMCQIKEAVFLPD
jgi:hypothetical protein